MFLDLPLQNHLAVLVIEFGAVLASLIVLLLFSIASILVLSGIALVRGFSQLATTRSRRQSAKTVAWEPASAGVGKSVLRIAH